MANIITGIRIICSIALLFFPVFSPAFFALYIVAGISDMIDGTVARKTGTVSQFGSKLDTVADFLLVIVCLIILLPVIDIPMWLIGLDHCYCRDQGNQSDFRICHAKRVYRIAHGNE
ncbi:MAG: CDP-alcohol phosphatidyltransferase family protein [Acutalibacteraceae bacterium]|nr:CDP-alcohol phosphatidyltransferase family protein [Acutalibacteraceae bacterium]